MNLSKKMFKRAITKVGKKRCKPQLKLNKAKHKVFRIIVTNKVNCNYSLYIIM